MLGESVTGKVRWSVAAEAERNAHRGVVTGVWNKIWNTHERSVWVSIGNHLYDSIYGEYDAR